jgi:hypothetical protein
VTKRVPSLPEPLAEKLGFLVLGLRSESSLADESPFAESIGVLLGTKIRSCRIGKFNPSAIRMGQKSV